MKSKIVIVIMGVIMISFSGCQGDSPENMFWSWFQSKSDALHSIKIGDEPIANELAGELKKIHPSLTFEVSSEEINNVKEFIISADGNKDAFDSVIRLYDAKPVLPGWEIKKFRQRKFTSDINFKVNDIILNGDEIRYLFVEDRDPEKIGLLLFLPRYDKERRSEIAGACLLFLDGILGEYDIETKVGLFDVMDFSSELYGQSKPLSEIVAEFDSHFKN